MTDRPRLHEGAECSGWWWLPADPDETHPGVLRYDPDDGVRLSLIGGFEERALRHDDPSSAAVVIVPRDWSVVLGVANNRPVTLLDCLPTNTYSYNFGDPATQVIEAQTALVGVHLASAGDPVFTGCKASIEDLTVWAAESPLSGTVVAGASGKPTGGTLTLTALDSRSARYGNTTLRLGHYQTTPWYDRRRGRTVGRMTHHTVLRVEPDEPAALRDLSQVVHAVRDLVSLATHRACGLLWLVLTLPQEEGERAEGYPVVPREVDVYAQQTVRGDPEAKVPLHGGLFTCEDLPFETVVPRWLEIRDRFAATCNLILGLRYVPGGYLETQLTQAVTAAEAMHQALELDPPIPEEEFRALRAILLRVVPKGSRPWLSDRLTRNDPTLKARLRDLAARPDTEAMATLLPDPQQWAKMTTKARNDLAHTGQSPQFTVHELLAVARVTTAVVLLNLLHEVGLSGAQQQAILRDNRDLSTAASRSRKHCVKPKKPS